MLLVLVPIAVATLAGLVVLWPSARATPAEIAAKSYVPAGATYPAATVVSLSPYDCSTTTGGRIQPQTCATSVVEVTDGSGAGSSQQVDLPPDVIASGIGIGDRVVLVRDAGAEGGTRYSFYDYSRSRPLWLLALLFVVVVAAVARWRGLLALVGLAFAFGVLLLFVLPALLDGSSPTWVSLVGAAAIMFVVLYLAHGFSARTTTALIGTLFGLGLVAGLGAFGVGVAHLTGFSSEQTVQLQTFDPTLNFSGLVIAGVVVAGLGVLNDVTVTQASAVWQLWEVDPGMSWRELFSRGMAIGRDHIASTVYTIVFAYAGTTLPLLLLFKIYAQPVGTVLTGSAVAEEVIRTLVGAVALVLAVPVTTAVGAFVVRASGPARLSPPQPSVRERGFPPRIS
jgi:uncharacterized membrane protein